MPDTNLEPPPDFESALSRLEDIVKTLEDGDLPLEKALEVFEEGIRLSRFCHQKLEQAERRVEILLADETGEVRTVGFEETSPLGEPKIPPDGDVSDAAG